MRARDLLARTGPALAAAWAVVKREAMPHVGYAKYVLLHKFYVFRAGHVIRRVMGGVPESRVRWYWRLLVHDASKFRPSEWRPYAASFYGESPERKALREVRAGMTAAQLGLEAQGYTDHPLSVEVTTRTQTIERERRAAFNAAWLRHIHRNPHHWQHHILHEDSGKVFVLVPEAALAYEMVADWLAAGPKALRAHTMAEAVAETIVWYARANKQQQMREIVRSTAENILMALAYQYGVAQHAEEVRAVQRTRASITIPGR